MVLLDGFAFRSQHDLLAGARVCSKQAISFDPDQLTCATTARRWPELIHRLRPELDIYLLTERDVEALAGQRGQRRRSAASSTASKS